MHVRTVFLAATLAVASGMASGIGAEIQLRPRCQARTAIVTLGDVADVAAADPQQSARLAAIELFPAPAPGQQRILRARELQDQLAGRGVSLAEHCLSGASQVTIVTAGEALSAADQRPLSASAAKRAERLVSDAILRYLEEHAGAEGVSRVQVKLTDEQARVVALDGRKISVCGGQRPWIGPQRFEVSVEDPTRPVRFEVAAEVSRPQPVVVAVKAIARGETIRAADVELQPPPSGAESADAFHNLEEVVGAEAAQNVAAGMVLQKPLVRPPVLVRRGELIAVYARAGGIRVRVTARAREDGALGDLVTVESLPDRKTYTARVSGLQEAEVYARARQASSSPAGNAAPRAASGLVQSNRRSR